MGQLLGILVVALVAGGATLLRALIEKSQAGRSASRRAPRRRTGSPALSTTPPRTPQTPRPARPARTLPKPRARQSVPIVQPAVKTAGGADRARTEIGNLEGRRLGDLGKAMVSSLADHRLDTGHMQPRLGGETDQAAVKQETPPRKAPFPGDWLTPKNLARAFAASQVFGPPKALE